MSCHHSISLTAPWRWHAALHIVAHKGIGGHKRKPPRSTHKQKTLACKWTTLFNSRLTLRLGFYCGKIKLIYSTAPDPVDNDKQSTNRRGYWNTCTGTTWHATVCISCTCWHKYNFTKCVSTLWEKFFEWSWTFLIDWVFFLFLIEWEIKALSECPHHLCLSDLTRHFQCNPMTEEFTGSFNFFFHQSAC